MENRVGPEGGRQLEPEEDKVNLVGDLVRSDESGGELFRFGGKVNVAGGEPDPVETGNPVLKSSAIWDQGRRG